MSLFFLSPKTTEEAAEIFLKDKIANATTNKRANKKNAVAAMKYYGHAV